MPTATAATAVPLDVRPLSPTLGAEILGLDLRRPLDPATRDAVYAAFVRHHVLCFRDQDLSKREQVAFSEQFGELEGHTLRNRGLNDEPFVHVVSNLDDEGRPIGKVRSDQWHTDKSFRPRPSLATILHARTLPPGGGGDTVFANMHAAYADLDAADRAELERLRVVHSWELSRENVGRVMSEEEKRDAPTNVWPLVRVHPDTGAKCLFVGCHASHLDGLPMADGRARIEALEDHATSERFTYRHSWRKGDVLMWDNRCLLHRADANFDAGVHPRILHRTCLRGTAPA